MNRKKIAVIGLGDFGKELVKCLYEEKHEVIAIDLNMELRRNKRLLYKCGLS